MALDHDQLVRLECIKLCYRHDRSAADITSRAADLLGFIVGQKLPVPSRKKGGGGGQAEQDNSPI